jgi:TRAP-type uncharacterized transport system fused permease subunit
VAGDATRRLRRRHRRRDARASGIGALLSPPTLGAAAFLIAEYLRISYFDVLVMATIPTVLYYLSIALMIEGKLPGSGYAGTRVPGID